MNGLIKRPPMWFAFWKHEGKTYRITTGLKIEGNKKVGGELSASASQKAAERIATAWREASKGEITYKQAIATLDGIPNLPPAVRNAAKDKARSLAIIDGIGEMPSIREYLEGYQGDSKAENNRKNAFRKFIAFLGTDADKRLDSLSIEQCRAFIRDGLTSPIHGVSAGQMRNHRNYLKNAYKTAIQDNILDTNPWESVDVMKISKAVNPELGDDKIKRQPFTLEEMNILCTKIAQPWRDMVLISFLTGGQRIGDIACLKWQSVNFKTGLVSFNTTKTGKRIAHPMVDILRDCLTRLYDERMDDVYVFPDMADSYHRSKGYPSTQFTALLQAIGINPAKKKKDLKGNRRAMATKSFHSIRHTVVSMLRSSNAFSADITRAIVGHDSEEVERAYFTAPQDVLLSGLSHLAEQAGLKS